MLTCLFLNAYLPFLNAYLPFLNASLLTFVLLTYPSLKMLSPKTCLISFPKYHSIQYSPIKIARRLRKKQRFTYKASP